MGTARHAALLAYARFFLKPALEALGLRVFGDDAPAAGNPL
jgi:hypothetical protein